MEGLWQKAADRMRETLGQVGYETWIGPLNFLGMEGGPPLSKHLIASFATG